MKGNFAVAWDEIGLENEIEETALLSEIKTLEEGIKKIIQHLSMQACERTDILKDCNFSHVLLLSGNYLFKKGFILNLLSLLSSENPLFFCVNFILDSLKLLF